MHSRPSVCTERWFIQLVCLGAAFTEAVQCGCSKDLRDPVPVQSFPPSQRPCLIWGKFFSQSNLRNFYRILSGFMIPVKWTQCWETLTDVTKEINPVAVVCPSFCFLWKVEWKWNNQTWIPSQNPDFPGKIWFSCLSSTFNDVFCPGWDCGRVGWISPWFSLPFLPCLCNSCREGLTHGHFIQWLFNKTQEYISRAGRAEERTSCTF